MSTFRVILLLIGIDSALKGSELESNWHQLESNGRQNLWFVAFEEAAFIRETIGDWLPIGLYKTGEKQAFRWKIESAVRMKNECKIAFVFVNQNGKFIRQFFEWTDAGVDGDLHGSLTTEGADTHVTFKQHDQSTRRFLIRRSLSVEELREKIRISKAQLSWKWENLRQVDL